jgi:glycosyltransferase involved in cell wall biosynthesis
MKVNILDSGLAERAGHHYDFDLKLARGLVAAGHDVRVYGFKNMFDDTFAEFQEVAPTTKLFQYFHYLHTNEFDPYSPNMVAFHKQSQGYAADLAKVEPADLWVWPTFDLEQLMACAMVGTKARVVGCVHYDPGFESRTISALLWRLALVTAYDKGLQFVLGSVESELRHRYMPILNDKRFAVLPQPFDGPPRTVPSPALKRIGIFGYQRGEKGTGVITPLIERLVAEGYTVVYHDSNSVVRYVPPEHPQVERLGFVDDLAVPIATCDLIILPYDPEQYRLKGSGILAQALALGIPTIAPYGTLPGRTVEQFQVGQLFGALTPQAILATVRFMDRHYARFAANAIRAGEVFAKQHGAARFMSTILSFAN